MLKKLFFVMSLVACCNSIISMGISDAMIFATCDAMQASFDRQQLHSAAKTGNLSQVIRLLKTQEYDINAEMGDCLDVGHTPLYHALDKCHEDVALELLNQGADPNAGSVPPIHVAIEHGLTKVVKALLSKGAHVANAEYRKKLDLILPPANTPKNK